MVTANNVQQVRKRIADYFIEKGYLDVAVDTQKEIRVLEKNRTNIDIVIAKGKKIKIDNITFTGNENIPARKLKKLMRNTHRRLRRLSTSKLVEEDYRNDLQSILDYYRTHGYRDARIVKDTIRKLANGYRHIDIALDEGQAYFFGDIRWKGNTLYTDQHLTKVFGLKRGDLFDESLLESRLHFSMDGRDISSLYMNDGYLFFQVEAIEVAMQDRYIDLEIRIFEGPQATVDKVIITGNDITNEAVIRRAIRTKPGKQFSRSDIIRSQREIMNLGFFSPDPNELKVTPKVNPERGTVDIEYEVVEKPSDQIELSAGWQPRTNGSKGSVIGTLGFSMTNFSLRHLLRYGFSNGLPRGDGQVLTLRGQANGQGYSSVNFSFTEPWLGGKRPNALTFAGFYNQLRYGLAGSESEQSLNIAGASVRFGTQLKVPDDFFVYSARINFQRIELDNWTQNGFNLSDGNPLQNGTFYNF
ncbi:MAG: POTRA domain-containing protein, partial [Bacteroidota bacterium]